MKSLWKNFLKYRFLAAELIRKEIKLKYRRSYLGIIWTLLEPLLTMLVLTIVFGGFYGKSDQSFPVYILTGRLLYTFFSGSTKAATKAIRKNASMIKKVYMPKYLYPICTTVANYIMFLISLIVLVAVALVLGVYPTKYVFNVIWPLIILFVMTCGIGMILSTLAVFFRDMEYLWGVISMLIMYSSAIFYEPARVVKTGYGWVLQYNPLYACIVNFRCAVFGEPMDMWCLGYSVIVAVVSMTLGILIFYRNQDKFILHI